MKRLLTGAFLRTRVGRRIVLVFIACAVLPITLMGVLSYQSIASQIREQSDDRLYRASKINGQALMQRLALLGAELGSPATVLQVASSSDEWTVPAQPSHFLRLTLTAFDTVQPSRTTRLTADALDHLRQGKPLLLTGSEAPGRIMMATLVTTAGGERIAWGEPDPAFLWAEPLGNGALPPTPDFCVLSGATPIYCEAVLAERIASLLSHRDDTRHFDWTGEDDQYRAASWPLFLRFAYLQDDWTIVVSEARSAMLQPLSSFKLMHVMSLGIVLAVVALLSQISVRRTLQPLEALNAATERIARRELATRVDVTSDDEFGVLARSFNTMAASLETQFTGLDAIAELGQRLLTARDPHDIADATLPFAVRIIPSGMAALVILPPAGDRRGMAESWIIRPGEAPAPARPIPIDPAWYAMGSRAVLASATATDTRIPKPLVETHAAFHVIQPFRIDGAVAGYLAFARQDTELSAEHNLFLHQLVDLVTVALSAVRLVRELDSLSWGALRALARAIDAKSPWTGGHSDRVTAIAVAIGRRMGLPDVEVERIHRGGLLHDVGKIGVSAAVLDKPGKLDEAEWAQMKSHPTLGARILEPIQRYADVIPIVLYHHERFDGRGYPEGLAGERIPLLARVLAVADVFDALVSDRPYRPGMSEQQALRIIEQGCGSHFDPEIGSLFLEMMRGEAVASVRALYRDSTSPVAIIQPA